MAKSTVLAADASRQTSCLARTGSAYNLAMRVLGLGLVLLGTALGVAFGCGAREGGSGTETAAGGATASAGASGAGTSAGRAGGGAAGGNATAGKASSDGGAPGLVDCDPKKILCKRLAPECNAGEVPSVDGSCYGDCVKVEQCACSAAAECPEPDQYTCWAQQHCGPFVR